MSSAAIRKPSSSHKTVKSSSSQQMQLLVLILAFRTYSKLLCSFVCIRPPWGLIDYGTPRRSTWQTFDTVKCARNILKVWAMKNSSLSKSIYRRTFPEWHFFFSFFFPSEAFELSDMREMYELRIFTAGRAHDAQDDTVFTNTNICAKFSLSNYISVESTKKLGMKKNGRVNKRNTFQRGGPSLVPPRLLGRAPCLSFWNMCCARLGLSCPPSVTELTVFLFFFFR